VSERARRSEPGPGRDSRDRAGYLRSVGTLLWPPPAAMLPGRACRGGPDSELIAVPGLRDPRLLVPGGRLAGAAVVRGSGKPESALTRLAGPALGASLRAGLGGLVLRDRLVIRRPAGAQTIESHLSAVVGQRVEVGLRIGAPRANRKPVLLLVTPAGQIAGYAKVGVDELTARLVLAEYGALIRLASLPLAGIEVPQVQAVGRWRGLTVLVLTPLPAWRKRCRVGQARLAAAMAELAGSAGTEVAVLAASGYWQGLTARLTAAGDGQEQAALHAALDRIAGLAGGTALSFGAWHGDWTPWNMAATRGGLLLWDWERFGDCVPLGFDALHYWLARQVAPGRADPALAAAGCVRNAPALLSPFGVAGPQARLTALAYLADLSVRYLADRQEQAGARLGAPGRWLIPALTTAASEL